MSVKPKKMTHDEFVKNKRIKAISTAQDLIRCKIGIIAGSRILSSLRFEIEVPEDDQDFITFVGIDSEADDLPVGQERQYWSPNSLKEKDIEIKRCEDLYRQKAMEPFENRIKKWKYLV